MPPLYPSMEDVAKLIQQDIITCADITVAHHIFLNSWMLAAMKRSKLSTRNMTKVIRILQVSGMQVEWNSTGLTINLKGELS